MAQTSNITSRAHLIGDAVSASAASLRLSREFLARLAERALARVPDTRLRELLRRAGAPLQSWVLAHPQDAAKLTLADVEAELEAFGDERIARQPFTPLWAPPVLGSEVGLARAGVRPTVSFRPWDEAQTHYRAGCELLARVWPEAWDEFEQTICRIIFYDDPESIGGSSPQSFGAIYSVSHTHTPVSYANHLVHETGHHLLNVLRAMDPILRSDPEQPVFSGLRNTLRPAWRTVHAAFSLARMTAFCHRAQASLSGEPRDEALSLLRFFQERQIPTLRALEAVQWTDAGQALFEQMRAVRARIGEP